MKYASFFATAAFSARGEFGAFKKRGGVVALRVLAGFFDECGQIGGPILQDFVIPRDGGVARKIVDVGAIIAGGKSDGREIEYRRDQDDAVEMDAVVLLQIIAERGGAEGAVTFANQKFRRVPAIIAAEVGDDELCEGFDVLVDAVEIFFGGFAHGVAVAGAHRVDENEVGFVEEAFAVVDEFVGAGGVNVPSTVQARRGPKAPMCSHMVAEPGPPL